MQELVPEAQELVPLSWVEIHTQARTSLYCLRFCMYATLKKWYSNLLTVILAVCSVFYNANFLTMFS